jgi:murein DD-endopeptidase / murein LD-carboxypeptidase
MDHHKIIITRTLVVCMSICFMTFWGCSGSYPRFTSVDWKEQAKQENDEDNVIVEIDDIESSHNEKNHLIKEDYVLKMIKKRLGTPYKYGGKDENGFDCSGFTSYIYKRAIGVNILSVTTEQYKTGKKISKKDLIFGDLVFFNTTGRIPSHVGIFVGKNSFAHASVQKGISISSLSSAYYKKRYVGARRIVYER